jgi:hypothetical protein
LAPTGDARAVGAVGVIHFATGAMESSMKKAIMGMLAVGAMVTAASAGASNLKWKICWAADGENGKKKYWTAPMKAVTDVNFSDLGRAFQAHLKSDKGPNFYTRNFDCVSETSRRSVIAEKEKVMYANRASGDFNPENMIDTGWVHPQWAGAGDEVEKPAKSSGSLLVEEDKSGKAHRLSEEKRQEAYKRREAEREARRKSLQAKADADEEARKVKAAAAKAKADRELKEHKANCAARGIPQDKCPSRASAQ